MSSVVNCETWGSHAHSNYCVCTAEYRLLHATADKLLILSCACACTARVEWMLSMFVCLVWTQN